MSSQKKSSLADLLRTWAKKQLDAKYDYTLQSNRKQDILDFIETHKSQLTASQQTTNAVRSSFTPILEKEMKARGLDPNTLGRSKKGMGKKLKFNSDMNSTITPSPQAGENDTTPKQTPQDPNAPQVQQVVQSYDESSVSATFSALFLTFRMALPDLELLTDDEKKALGKMWLPAFNLYMQNEKWAVIGIPVMGTLGIFLPKMLQARRISKMRKSALTANMTQKEIDEANLKEQTKREQKENETKKTTVTAGEPLQDNIDITKPRDTLPKEE